jgi:hypothetical protein
MVTKKGRRVLKHNVRECKDYIKESLSKDVAASDFKNLISIRPKNSFIVNVKIRFVLKQRFWVRDTGNMLKAVEDAIAEYFAYSDAYHINLDIGKLINKVSALPEEVTDMVCFSLKLEERDDSILTVNTIEELRRLIE